MMEGAFFVSRTELLQWVNGLLQVNLAKVEQCASGAVYCQIVDSIYPGNVAMRKVNWMGKADHEYIPNYKVLQAAFDKIGIQKNIDVDKLIRGKYQDNLEFLQWMKCCWDREASDVECDPGVQAARESYDALHAREGRPVPEWGRPGGPLQSQSARPAPASARSKPAGVYGGVGGEARQARRSQPIQKENARPASVQRKKTLDAPSATTKAALRSPRPLDSRDASKQQYQNVDPSRMGDNEEVETLREQLATLNAKLVEKDLAMQELMHNSEGVQEERDYYYTKLVKAENILAQDAESFDSMTCEQLAQQVLEILYTGQDDDGDDHSIAQRSITPSTLEQATEQQ